MKRILQLLTIPAVITTLLLVVLIPHSVDAYCDPGAVDYTDCLAGISSTPSTTSAAPATTGSSGVGSMIANIAGDAVLAAISWLMYWLLIYVMGILAALGGELLVYAANFTGFTDAPIIIQSWTVVRDLSNMFFIVILLMIAFGTLLRLEAYSWKKLLPKMVLAAILMNYSRAICGVLVDASEVVMLTFTAAIAPAISQNLVNAFQLNHLLEASRKDAGNDTLQNKNELLAIATVGFMLTILVTIEFVYIAVLVGRLAFIWFLTVLSPLAFACSVLPATEKYYKQWWEMFGRYITVGPMILFYLWLSLYISAKTSGNLAETAAPNMGAVVDSSQSTAEVIGVQTNALDSKTVIGFVIATMMLMAGLKMAQDNSSELGSITGKASSISKWITKAPYRYGALPLVGALNDRFLLPNGFDLNPTRFIAGIKHKREEILNRRKSEGRIKAGQLAQAGNPFGIFGAPDIYYQQYMPIFGIQGAVIGKKALLSRFVYGQGQEDNAKKELEAKEKEQEVLDAHKTRYEKTPDFLDTRIGSEDRVLLVNIKKGLDPAKDSALIKEIDDLLNENGGKGDVDTVISVDVEARVGAYFTEQQDKKKKEIQIAKDKAKEWAPISDFEGLAKQQALLAEANKEFHGEKNEDKLRIYIREKFEEKDVSYMLGGLLQMAKVGHLNEACKEFKVDQSVDGLKELTEMIINECGGNREQVMAAMNDITAAARDDVGHWIFAESVGYKNGRHVWRSKDEQYDRIASEGAKYGASNIARKTHLSMIQYKYRPNDPEADGQGYIPQLFYPTAKIVAQAMPTLVDLTHKNLANQQLGQQLFNNTTTAGQKNAQDFRNLVDAALVGKDAKIQIEAEKAMDNWENGSTKGGNHDLQEAIDEGFET